MDKRDCDTFNFEASHSLSAAEIVHRHNSGLEFDSNLQQKANELLKQIGIISKLSNMSFLNLVELMRLYPWQKICSSSRKDQTITLISNTKRSI